MKTDQIHVGCGGNKVGAQGGFTLLELLAVIAIVSLLTGISVNAVTGLRHLLAERESWIRFTELTQALRLYRLEEGDWPQWMHRGEHEINDASTDWRDSLARYYEGPHGMGTFKDGYGNERVYVVVDLDGDNWIVADDFAALTADQRPQRIHAKVAAYSLDGEGRLVTSTWK